jgi:hypothetical protein
MDLPAEKHPSSEFASSYALRYAVRQWKRIAQRSQQLRRARLFISTGHRQYTLRLYIRSWMAVKYMYSRQRLHAISIWRRYILKHRTYRHAESWHKMAMVLRYWKQWRWINEQHRCHRRRCLHRAWTAWKMFIASMLHVVIFISPSVI